MSNIKKRVNFNPIYLTEVIEKYDRWHPLPNETAFHALLDYAVKVGALLEDQVGAIEGIKQQPVIYSNLMQSIALVYGCEVETMVKFWKDVDWVLEAEGFKVLPTLPEIRGTGGLII